MQIRINLQIFLFIILFLLTKQIELYALIMFFALIHEFRPYFCRFTFEVKTKKTKYNAIWTSSNFWKLWL